MTLTNQNRHTPAFLQHGIFAPHLGVIQKKVATHCFQEFDSISWKMAEHFSFVLSLISLEFLSSGTFSHLDYLLLTITISQFGKNGQEDKGLGEYGAWKFLHLSFVSNDSTRLISIFGAFLHISSSCCVNTFLLAYFFCLVFLACLLLSILIFALFNSSSWCFDIYSILIDS